MEIEDGLSCSGRSECVLMWAKPGESGGLLVQSAHSSPLTLPCLSILFFPHSPALPLWGSTSINNTALSATPFPRCVWIYACTCACTRVICLLYTQRSQTCMQTPCVQIQHFLNTHRSVCALPSGLFVCICVWGFSGMTHHSSRCLFHPALLLQFRFVSQYFTPLLCFLSFLYPDLKGASQLLADTHSKLLQSRCA